MPFVFTPYTVDEVDKGLSNNVWESGRNGQNISNIYPKFLKNLGPKAISVLLLKYQKSGR